MNSHLMLRMIAPTAAISFLLLAVGVGAAWHVKNMQQNLSNTLQVNVASMRSAEELEILVHETRTLLHHYLLTRDRHHLERISPLKPEIERWLGEAVRWATTKQEQALMRRVTRGLGDFFNELDNSGLLAEDVRARRMRRMADDLVPHQILEPTHEYLDYNEKELEKTSRQNRIQSGRLVLGLLLLGVCGCGAGLVAGLGLARAVNRSLVQLSVPLRAAAGQLDEVVGPITFAARWDLHELEGVLTTIAERIAAMVQRLRQSEREVLRAEQLAAVGQMAAGMAHELRNPLMAIKILVQSALAGPEGKLKGRDLAVLDEEISRLEEVITTFLHFARPPVPQRRRVELGPIIEATIDLIAARALMCDVRVEPSLPLHPVEASVDPGQMRQVLLNLLLNALDAVTNGGRIWVELEPDEDQFVLRVRDNGTGLPEELQPKIFTPFVSTKETGLGLGLSICKRIVEAHGGEITAANDPDGGALFEMCIPLGNPASALAPVPG